MKPVLAFLVLSLPASAVLSVDFESVDDLSNSFTVAGGTTGISVIGTGVGFDGSDGVNNLTATRAHAFVVPQSFSGDLSSWSTSILWNPGNSTASQFTIGVADSPDVFMTGTVPSAIQNAGDSTFLFGSIYSIFASGGINVTTTEPGVNPVIRDQTLTTLGLNTWYHVSLDVTFNGGISYTATASISAVDGTGAPTSTLVSASSTFDNATLSADGEVYTFFGVTDIAGTMDEFVTTAVVPEPHSLLLCSLSTGLLFLRRRRSC
ncbi:hypothetical protein HNR46_001801 [Haloferula luteola]|uniref:PEP-CTERM protein-sorting domain-containing protein n=1 Tax=Haloferula luteola TaxID=595692 RepID=A0A840V7K2_9BACT|nr:PEP-CTERM sorting domain-containing protein [Haloferula luteola]MBB5351564.1 hypothetical protein [Haloferula luteola]